ncbi:MAG: putative Ig domain-containing protein, partial [Acidimicrobiia bacterium]
TALTVNDQPLTSGGAATGLDFGAGNGAPTLTTRSQAIRFGSTPAPLDASDPEGTGVVYTLASGDLPTGVGLNTDGTFRGVAGHDGTFRFTVSVCDTAGIPSCSTFDYTITVEAVEVLQSADVLPFTGMDIKGLLALAALLMLSGMALLGSLSTSWARRED